MKIRAITGFTQYESSHASLERFTSALHSIRDAVSPVEVQFVRLSFQNFDKLFDLGSSVPSLLKRAKAIENDCHRHGIEIINFGTLAGKAVTPSHIRKLAAVLAESGWSFGTVSIDRWDERIFLETAEVFRTLSRAWPGGLANIKFSVLFNVPPYSPFFPGAYHPGGRNRFSVGLEWGEELIEASQKARGLPDFTARLAAKLNAALRPLETKLIRASKKAGVAYEGIDVSLATSLGNQDTLGRAWKNLGYEFGAPGSLAISRAITQAIESVRVKKCGYSGLMIPILEDTGLAAVSKKLTMQQILHYSSVCGTGLDTIPLPGDISAREIADTLKDVYALSDKWQKPLSVRLFPIPGKKRGQRTKMNCPYLVDAHVM